MTASLIQVYLNKVASGDHAYDDKLCNQIAERLVYVPSLATVSAQFGKSTRVSVVRMKDSDKDVIPIFTSERAFEDWRAQTQYSGGNFSLICADLCLAAGPHSWIKIDPGSSAEVTLSPDQVDKIAKTGLEEQEAPAPPQPVQSGGPAVEQHPGYVSSTVIVRSSKLLGDPEQGKD